MWQSDWHTLSLSDRSQRRPHSLPQNTHTKCFLYGLCKPLLVLLPPHKRFLLSWLIHSRCACRCCGMCKPLIENCCIGVLRQCAQLWAYSVPNSKLTVCTTVSLQCAQLQAYSAHNSKLTVCTTVCKNFAFFIVKASLMHIITKSQQSQQPERPETDARLSQARSAHHTLHFPETQAQNMHEDMDSSMLSVLVITHVTWHGIHTHQKVHQNRPKVNRSGWESAFQR